MTLVQAVSQAPQALVEPIRGARRTSQALAVPALAAAIPREWGGLAILVQEVPKRVEATISPFLAALGASEPRGAVLVGMVGANSEREVRATQVVGGR